MLRQLITFAFIVLVAVFIISDMQWSGPGEQALMTQSNAPAGLPRQQQQSDGEISFTDFRSGGAVRRSRPTKPGAGLFESVRPAQMEAATSTAFTAASSSPFQVSGSGTSNVTFSSKKRSLPGAIPTAPIKRPASVVRPQPTPVVTEKLGNQFEDQSSDLKISGRIVDEAGNVIKDLPLTLQLTQAVQELQKQFTNKVLNTRSDEAGAYVFENLVEGTYRVCTVESRGYKPVCQTPRAPHSSADFSLRGTLNVKIHGVVVDGAGTPLKDVSVSATPGQKNRAVTDEEGRYELAMTVSDALSYQVYFSKKDYQRERVANRGSEIRKGKEINAVLEKTELNGFEITGTIYDQSGSPVSGQTVTLYSPSIKSKVALRAASNSEGKFTIKYVTAGKDYRLNVATRGGYSFDGAEYQTLDIYEGMSPIQLQLKSGGKASFSARVVQQNGTPLAGEVFTLYSGSAYAGRANSNTNGEIVFEEVPVQEGGSKLRISSTASPRYSFSGMSLAPGVHQSGLELRVDRGEYNLRVLVADEDKQAIQGARAVLTWSYNRDGVLSQTSRSRGKTSIAGSGEINFSELGSGEHRLQISLSGYQSYSQTINISRRDQQLNVVLKKQ